MAVLRSHCSFCSRAASAMQSTTFIPFEAFASSENNFSLSPSTDAVSAMSDVGVVVTSPLLLQNAALAKIFDQVAHHSRKFMEKKDMSTRVKSLDALLQVIKEDLLERQNEWSYGGGRGKEFSELFSFWV